nr:MAG TPA: hypothetical protein [Caudoviricetes sp.]
MERQVTRFRAAPSVARLRAEDMRSIRRIETRACPEAKARGVKAEQRVELRGGALKSARDMR